MCYGQGTKEIINTVFEITTKPREPGIPDGVGTAVLSVSFFKHLVAFEYVVHVRICQRRARDFLPQSMLLPVPNIRFCTISIFMPGPSVNTGCPFLILRPVPSKFIPTPFLELLYASHVYNFVRM